MTTEQRSRLSVDEIAALREVVKWRRANGFDFDFLFSRYLLNDGRVFMWLSTDSQATCMKVGVTPNYGVVASVWHKVASVTQALDLLVALGYLPARFSTAYRAGWDAAHEDREIGYARTPYAELAPAWGPTW